MASRMDPEIRTTNALLKALEPLDLVSRRRVFDYLASRLGMDALGSLTQAIKEMADEIGKLKRENEELKKAQ